jgi:hypothetical protein
MDVQGKFKNEGEQLVRILPTLQDDDYWLQEEEAGSSIRETVWRRSTRNMAGGSISEVIWPICMAAIFVIAYMFVKSFPSPTGAPNPSPLIRIGVVAIGPVAWNAAVLLALFFISLLLGPVFEKWTKFASVMAAVAHFLALVGILAFFELFVRALLYCFSRISQSVVVVPQTMGHIACRFGCHCDHCDPACDP